MHLKRQSVPKSWPVFRKGTKYIVRPGFGLESGIPLLVVLRDLLGVAQNRKEVKRAIHIKHILLNSKPATDEKNSMLLFDTISFVPTDKHYRLLVLSKGRFSLEEIEGKEAGRKIIKIVNKKTLKGKKVQLNFSDGRNLISDVKCRTGDSAVVNIKEKKIEKIIPLKEKSDVFVFLGKHAGKKGKLTGIDGGKKTAEIELEGKPVHVLIKQLMATE